MYCTEHLQTWKESPRTGESHGRVKVGLTRVWAFKKPKINPSQWQSAPWGEQRSKAKHLYKMFNSGGLCGLVFGRAFTHSRPTTELATEGQRQEAGHCLPHPCALQSRLGPALPSR